MAETSQFRLRRPLFAKFYFPPTYQPLEDRRMLTFTNENGQTDGKTEFFKLTAHLVPMAQQFFMSNEMIPSGPVFVPKIAGVRCHLWPVPSGP